MTKKIHFTDADVDAKLDELGLTRALLVRLTKQTMRIVMECTELDPPGTAGFLFWAKMTRFLREELIPQGWVRSNAENFAIIIHPSNEFSIVVAAGDGHTGNPSLNPSTRTEKGPVGQRAIVRNQLSFAAVNSSFPWPESDHMPRSTWFLLHSADLKRGEVRVELSLAGGTTEGGIVDTWLERIVIGMIEVTEVPEYAQARPDLEPTSEIKLDITRIKA